MNSEKQAQARHLFFQTELSKTQIADALGVPRRTLHYWISQNNWEVQKRSAAHMPVLLAENCYHIIAKFTEHILSEERKDQPITHKEADTLHKMVITIGKLKNRSTLNESMEMLGCFMDSVHQKSPELAQAITPLVEDYIATRSTVGLHQFQPTIHSTPTSTNTSAQPETERQLDLQDIAAWEQQAKTQQQTNQTNNTQPHNRPHINDELPQTQKARRETPPTYDQFLADLRRQDETLKHLYPRSPQPKPAKAA